MDNKHPLGEEALNEVGGGTIPVSTSEGDDKEYKCLACGKVFKKSQADTFRLVDSDGNTVAVYRTSCPGCGSDAILPVGIFP